MTTPLYCLMGFVFWTVILVLAIGAVRISQVFAGKVAVTGFPAGQPHGGDAYWRLNRAHMNCVENLPLFGVVVLTGHVTGLTSGSFATLAQTYVFARVAQSLVHVMSGAALAINVRFACFFVQVVSLVLMANAIVSR